MYISALSSRLLLLSKSDREFTTRHQDQLQLPRSGETVNLPDCNERLGGRALRAIERTESSKISQEAMSGGATGSFEHEIQFACETNDSGLAMLAIPASSSTMRIGSRSRAHRGSRCVPWLLLQRRICPVRSIAERTVRDSVAVPLALLRCWPSAPVPRSLGRSQRLRRLLAGWRICA